MCPFVFCQESLVITLLYFDMLIILHKEKKVAFACSKPNQSLAWFIFSVHKLWHHHKSMQEVGMYMCVNAPARSSIQLKISFYIFKCKLYKKELIFYLELWSRHIHCNIWCDVESTSVLEAYPRFLKVVWNIINNVWIKKFGHLKANDCRPQKAHSENLISIPGESSLPLATGKESQSILLIIISALAFPMKLLIEVNISCNIKLSSKESFLFLG